MEQKDFLELAHAGKNIDLTGVAGSGKTYVLKQFIDQSIDKRKNVVVVAPTGVAAINIGGSTIHSTFAIWGNDYFIINRQKVEWEKIHILIIDEKSMVGPDMMDHISRILSVSRKNQLPFGGLQVILCGDLAQLPPVYKVDKENATRYRNLQLKYGKLIYSSAKAFKESSFDKVELTTVFRQKDETLINILNRLREGDIFAAFEIKRGGYTEEQEKNSVHIMPFNNMVDAYNKKQYDLVDAPEMYYKGNVKGKFNIDNVLSPLDLYLKPGVRVMLTKNILDAGVYNGDLGNVVECRDGEVLIDFDRVGKMVISYATWEQKEYNEVESVTVGSFSQVPLKLAYAITTHKSQGLSLDKVIVHYTHGMSNANLYTALSRATNLENLFLAK